MTLVSRMIGAAVAVALVGSVWGCAPSPAPTPSVTSTPSPTASAPSPAEQDLESAKAAVVEMWALYDEISNNPTTRSIDELVTVASGEWLTTLRKLLMQNRAQTWTSSGYAVVEDLEAELAGTNAQGRTEWTVTACIDSSTTTLVDQDGKSVVGPPYRVVQRSTVEKRDGEWYVTAGELTGTC